MGINDGFVDTTACSHCGEGVVRRLQIKIEGVSMKDYSAGDPVSSALLDSVRRSEEEFLAALGQDLKIPDAELSKSTTESQEGSFAVIGTAYRIGPACRCGQAPEQVSCVAVVDHGVFTGLMTCLPEYGPIVSDHGAVIPRWVLKEEALGSAILDLLE